MFDPFVEGHLSPNFIGFTSLSQISLGHYNILLFVLLDIIVDVVSNGQGRATNGMMYVICHQSINFIFHCHCNLILCVYVQNSVNLCHNFQTFRL